MSLRIRRGLEQDRVGQYFDQGELIYITDKNKLYVGDKTGVGTGTAGGLNILANSLKEGSGLFFNTFTQEIDFRLSNSSLTTQTVPEAIHATYTSGSGTTFVVSSNLGISPYMNVYRTNGSFIGTVDSTSDDGVTVILQASAASTPTNGENITFQSVNLYHTDQRAVNAINTALTNGASATQGITFHYDQNTQALSAIANVLPPYAASAFPSSPAAGTMIFDSTNNLFKGWNGSTWVTLG